MHKERIEKDNHPERDFSDNRFDVDLSLPAESAICQRMKDCSSDRDRLPLGEMYIMMDDGRPHLGFEPSQFLAPLVRFLQQFAKSLQQLENRNSNAMHDPPPAIPDRMPRNDSPASGQSVLPSVHDYSPDSPIEAYGAYWAGNGPGNLTLDGRQVSQVFVPERSGPIHSVQWYNRVNSQGGRTGYSKGDGGDVYVQIRADVDGKPSERILAEGYAGKTDSSGIFETKLDQQVQVTKGEKYHIVFVNKDPRPRENYSSVNLMTSTYEKQPGIPDSEAQTLVRNGGSDSRSAWYRRTDRIPMFNVNYDFNHDGKTDWKWGNGYMGGVPQQHFYRLKDHLLEQEFKVTGGDKTFDQMRVRVGGSKGTLEVEVTDQNGNVVKTGLISGKDLPDPRSIPDAQDLPRQRGTFITVGDDRPFTLKNGETYRIRFKPSADSDFTMAPLKDGSAGYRLAGTFSDGFARIDNKEHSRMYDLPFGFMTK